MPFSKPVAVVDIGSNSVRLVIYDGLKRAPMPLFNEKILCGLAKNIEVTGCLNEDGVKKADEAIKRFLKLSEIMNVHKLSLFATSAVRDAKDGKDFVKNLKDEYGIDVNVLSGEEEARYAGMGVISSIQKSSGVVGDLGGGSLELIEVSNNNLKNANSFPIGPLHIPKTVKSKNNLGDFVEEYINLFPLKESLHNKTFYAVGGAFRSLAKIHMGRKNYPLKVIHNYKTTSDDFLNTLQVVSHMSEASLARLHGVSRKRLDFLPHAALILKMIIQIGKPKSVIFVTSGVREGFLYSQLCKSKKSDDPLISGCIEMMARILRPSDYGYELSEWMSPLFVNNDNERLRLAACIMSEISCYENTEYRAELAYRKVLDSSLIGLNHKERVFIAKALYCRYSTDPDEHILSTMYSLLNTENVQAVQIIGSAMRLGRSLSCSHSGILKNTKLKVSNNKVTLEILPGNDDLNGEVVKKRIKQLSEIMGLKPVLL